MNRASAAEGAGDGQQSMDACITAELARAREEVARLRRDLALLKLSQSNESIPGASNGSVGGLGASHLPPPCRVIRRRHTDLDGLHDVVVRRRRHSVDDTDLHRTSLRDKHIHHSLGLWFLLANHFQFDDHENDISGDSSNHLTTVSVANDGRSSVATAAAAAVSVAMAKSWTSVGTPQHASSPISGVTPSSSTTSISLENSTKGAVPRTRFRLVAAIPKGPAKLLEAEERQARAEKELQRGKFAQSLKSERSIPLDRLHPTEDSATEWAAYGAHLKLQWMSKPKRALVVFKLSHEAREAAIQAIHVLLMEGASVYVEPGQYDAINDLMLNNDKMSATAATNNERLSTWSCGGDARNSNETQEESCHIQTIPEDISSMLDVIFTVGGDGTVLWACSLLGTVASVPPIVAISMGSLGFMTPFPISRLEALCSSVMSADRELPLLLRHRLECRIVRKNVANQGTGDSASDLAQFAAFPQTSNEHSSPIMVLNEVVIDRGMTANLTKLECFIDGNYVTVIQGDGLIVSTPTGSTAYNLAAGGSMVHPAVPCILFTPICPHTLSSRPLVFPEHVVLRLKVPADSREDLSCSFDGKMRTALRPGDSVVVYSCQSPVPMVCHLDASHDFFSSVKEGLDWNRRIVQSKPRSI